MGRYRGHVPRDSKLVRVAPYMDVAPWQENSMEVDRGEVCDGNMVDKEVDGSISENQSRRSEFLNSVRVEAKRR